MQMLFVVVLAPIDQHLANSEEITEFLKCRETLGALRHRELRKHLVAGSVAFSPWTARLPHQAD